jgi:hypothetical protein
MMMKMRVKPLGTALALAFLLALSILVCPLLVAQETSAPQTEQKNQNDEKKAKYDYALIYGTVWGKDNRPVYGVPIKIRRADQNKAKWELTSDHRGEFAQRVPVGKADYIVWADVKVPKGQQKPETKAHIENNERIDVSLHLTK